MCKECGAVVGAVDIENGICKTCIEKGVIVEPIIKNSDKEIPLVSFGNPFSFKNRSGRLDYLVFGVLVPYAIMGLSYYMAIMLESPVILIGILIAGIIAIAATIRRARDTKDNVIVVAILSIIPYVNILVALYLLFVPSKHNKV